MGLKQMHGKIWVGRIKTTVSRASTYFGYINFILLLLTFYSVAGYKYAPIWVFLTVSVIALVVVGAADYFVILPSEQAFANQQIARHQNPMYEAIIDIQKRIGK